MLGELFPAVVSRVKKESKSLNIDNVVTRLNSSSFITTKASHDSSLKENISDLKAVYDDINMFYNLFCCDVCSRLVSCEYINEIDKSISCKCGKKAIEWK